MRLLAATSSQFDNLPPRQSFPASFDENSQLCFLERRLNLSNPFGSFGIGVLGIYVFLGVFLSRFDVFQTVRFLPDTLDLVDLDVSPLQQSNRLPVTWIAQCICTFCLWVKFVLGHNVSTPPRRTVLRPASFPTGTSLNASTIIGIFPVRRTQAVTSGSENQRPSEGA